MRLQVLKKMTEQMADSFHMAKGVLEREKAELVKSTAKEKVARQARDVIQQVGQAVQQEAHTHIGNLVSRCLAGVFDQPYEFRVEFERKRNRTEARLVFCRDGHELPAEQVGGGVREVAAFALRVACLLLTKPPLRRLLVLDEPWTAVHNDLRPSVTALVETLAEELGMQFIVITQEREYEMGTVIEVE